MRFTDIILLSLSATGLMAIPYYPEATGLPEFEVDNNDRRPSSPKATGHPQIIYGDLKKRGVCANRQRTICSDNNDAPINTCDDLIADLSTNSNTPVRPGDRSICRTTEGSKVPCCVSWNKEIQGLKQGDLIDLASSVKDSCASFGVSGRVTNASIRSACVTFCFSSGGDDCN